MKNKTFAFSLKTRTGSHDIETAVRQIGEDFVVSIWGGNAPHVGAVAVALPRPSLKNPRMISASASVFCVLGHKEDEMAKAVSEILAATLNARVVVAAGIHWDNLGPEGISRVVQNSEALVDLILKRIFRMKRNDTIKRVPKKHAKG